MLHSTYMLNKQGDNIQPCHTPFPILNQSIVPCSVLLLLYMDIGFSAVKLDGLIFLSLKRFLSRVVDVIVLGVIVVDVII